VALPGRLAAADAGNAVDADRFLPLVAGFRVDGADRRGRVGDAAETRQLRHPFERSGGVGGVAEATLLLRRLMMLLLLLLLLLLLALAYCAQIQWRSFTLRQPIHNQQLINVWQRRIEQQLNVIDAHGAKRHRVNIIRGRKR